MNLGADFDLPEAQWKELANRIKVINIRKSSRPEPHQKLIYEAMSIASVPGRTLKKIF